MRVPYRIRRGVCRSLSAVLTLAANAASLAGGKLHVGALWLWFQGVPYTDEVEDK